MNTSEYKIIYLFINKYYTSYEQSIILILFYMF